MEDFKPVDVDVERTGSWYLSRLFRILDLFSRDQAISGFYFPVGKKKLQTTAKCSEVWCSFSLVSVCFIFCMSHEAQKHTVEYFFKIFKL